MKLLGKEEEELGLWAELGKLGHRMEQLKEWYAEVAEEGGADVELIMTELKGLKEGKVGVLERLTSLEEECRSQDGKLCCLHCRQEFSSPYIR